VLRVVIADDSFIVRAGVVELLAAERDVEVVASCADGDALRAAVATRRPDVVLTDIRMPPSGDAEGLAVAEELRATRPDVGVVVVSQYASPAYALRLLDGGSERRAYLLKDRLSDRRQLVAALRTVAAGGSFVDATIIEALLESPSGPPGLADLPPREAATLALLAEGLSNEAIAERLGASRRAVEKDANAIFHKLGVGGEQRFSPRVMAALIFLRERESA
jgi:DNA-binding NarL/FixJ family response regulator